MTGWQMFPPWQRESNQRLSDVTKSSVTEGSSSSSSRLIDGVPTFPHIPMGDFLGVERHHHDRSPTNTRPLRLIVEGLQLKNGPCGVVLQCHICYSSASTFVMLSKVISSSLKLILAGVRQEISGQVRRLQSPLCRRLLGFSNSGALFVLL